MAKRNKMCPVCFLRSLMHKVDEKNDELVPYENIERKTPIMGWSSWNTFKNTINQDLIYDTAVAIKNTGLLDAGYEYVNLDDNWHSNMRDENDEWQGDLVRFSSGIPSLIEKINALGLKVGLYSSNGELTCEDLPASLGREDKDAYTLAKWGAEYFKYDFCHNVRMPEEAPLIFAIDISKKGSGTTSTIEVSNAILHGFAKRKKSKKLGGKEYVVGLDRGQGSITFDNVNVDADGEYILTLNILKYGWFKKFVEIKVNGEKRYPINIPEQKFFNVTARFQTIVELKAGRNTIEIYNPVSSKIASARLQYEKMAYAIKNATARVARETGKPEKKILFSICEWGGREPHTWGYSAGNMWRTTHDIMPMWWWIKGIYEHNVKLHEYASAGHFNDPDMLEVGNGKLTYDENMAHFALWCMMASPLVLGNDIRKIDAKVVEIVTNKELIAIDQDELGKQAKRVKKGSVDILAKPLQDGKTAVLFFNKSRGNKKVKFDLTKLVNDNFVKMNEKIGKAENIVGDVKVDGNIATATLRPHSVVVFKI